MPPSFSAVISDKIPMVRSFCLKPILRLLCMVGLLSAGLGLTGCDSLPGKKSKTPALNIPARWNLPGTMVVYMPKVISSAKQNTGDPIYLNWADALMGYVDESSFVQRILDEGRSLSPQVNISSKTVPSSDYSVLLIGIKGRAVHVQEPWQSPQLYLLLDDYLRGKGSAKNLPPGCEGIVVRTEIPKEEAAADGQTPASGDKPAAKPSE